MEVSFASSVVLPSWGERPQYTLSRRERGAPEPVWKLWRRESSSVLAGLGGVGLARLPRRERMRKGDKVNVLNKNFDFLCFTDSKLLSQIQGNSKYGCDILHS
jgi:hypothetical protein